MNNDLSPLILRGLASGDTIGGPTALASITANCIKHGTSAELSEIADRYMDYYQAGSFDSGPVFEKVHSLIDSRVNRRSAVRETHQFFHGMSAGCNPLHRTICLAGKLALNEQTLVSIVEADSTLTHFDPLASHVAVAGSLICRYIIDGMTITESVEKTLSIDFLEHLRAYANREPSASGFAPTVLFSAIHFAKTPQEGLDHSFKLAGGANYCPPIVGALQSCIAMTNLSTPS